MYMFFKISTSKSFKTLIYMHFVMEDFLFRNPSELFYSTKGFIAKPILLIKHIF